MTRREYVSFLGDRSRDITFSGRGPDPSRWVLLVVAVLAIALSVWWFGFREPDQAIVSERVTGETTVPTLLTPSALEDVGDPAAAVSLACSSTIGDWIGFQGGNERTGCLSTRMIEEPRILWHTPIGVTGWRNSPVVEDGVVYVGSAGVIQYVQDRRDGIYSLDLRTGQQRWLYSTELDVNSLAVRNGIVVAVGDEGRVWALRDEGAQGKLIWLDDLGSPAFGDPLFVGDDVIITDNQGRVWAYNVNSGNSVSGATPLIDLEGTIRGGASSDGERIYVGSDTGEVAALNLNYQIAWRIQLEGVELEVAATPTVLDDMILLSIARQSASGEPGIRALDQVTGEQLWEAEDLAALKLTGWANMRSSPAVAGDYIVIGEGYSNLMVVIDRTTGKTLWSADVGPFCYPHWPSPVVNTTPEGGAVVYLARHDGGLYAVDLDTREIVWQIYLGDLEGDGRTGVFPPNHKDSDFCQWGPEDGNSIFSSPAVTPEGTIVVGTGEGYIVAVGDPNIEG